MPRNELGPSLWGKRNDDFWVVVRHGWVRQQEVPDFIGLAGLSGPANLARLALVPTMILPPRRQRRDRKYCASGAYKGVSAVDLVIEPGRVTALVKAIEPKRNLPEFDGDRVQVDAKDVAVGNIGVHLALDVRPLFVRNSPVEFKLL